MQSKHSYKRIGLVTLIGCLMAGVLALAGCSGSASQTSSTSSTSVTTSGTTVRVASLKGPTSIGLVSFMDKAKAGQCANDYQFTVSGTADEIVPKVISGDIDIALVPANVASVLGKKTNGGISIIDINTLGVLSIVTGDSSIKDFKDLAGHTVYMTGKGATPEYVMNYLLKKAGIASKVKLEFKSEATEVASALATDSSAIGMLPEPYATAVTTKNAKLKSVINLTDVWNDTVSDGSKLVTGVTIVRNDFLSEHPDVVKDFISEQSDSVKTVKADPASSAQGVVDAGIVDSAAVAEKAIPNCQLVCITGSKMSKTLSGYYKVLYKADPSSVGGSVPTKSMYYHG